MATTYTKEQNGPVPRYKLNGESIKAAEVPQPVKTALSEAAPGTQVDELGDPINPDTDLDDSADENPPTNPDEDGDDGDSPPDDDTDADGQTDTEARNEIASEDATPQSTPGMGFKRSKGKTLSIFSNKPHETVKSIRGVMVPLTQEEYDTKTDAEIIKKLQDLKKL